MLYTTGVEKGYLSIVRMGSKAIGPLGRQGIQLPTRVTKPILQNRMGSLFLGKGSI